MCFVPSQIVLVETADCSRNCAAAALKGGDKDAADRKGEREKKTEKWNQTAGQSRRLLSLQWGYFKRMRESDALRGLKYPKVTTHKCSITFLPSTTTLLLHNELVDVSQFKHDSVKWLFSSSWCKQGFVTLASRTTQTTSVLMQGITRGARQGNDGVSNFGWLIFFWDWMTSLV